ncbi:hypothetical protein FY147_27790 (plasmid) [Agrobacterium tumefaciens]|nr:hypothetical protein [Agrobacterium tumefaciens]UXS66711.1 hypothetical protein FY147_27790 [Agrobacterium tumefaciens]
MGSLAHHVGCELALALGGAVVTDRHRYLVASVRRTSRSHRASVTALL